MAMGTPIDSSCPIMSRLGLRSSRRSAMPVFCRSIMMRDTATLIACASVVPSAAPAGPILSAPMNR